MPKLFDRAGMTTATTGTGTVTLGSAVTDSTNGNFQTFASAGAANLDVVNYLITDSNAWELGTGTYTTAGTTLSRTLGTSSTGSLLSLSGSAKVYSAPFATDIKTPNLTEYTSTTPAAPTSGSTLFSRKRAGRRILSSVPPSGMLSEVQALGATKAVAWWNAAGNTSTLNASHGAAAPVTNGTATARGIVTTSLLGATRRIGYVPASAAADQATGVLWDSLLGWFRSSAALRGGFFMVARFGFNTFTGGAGGNRAFIGMGPNWTSGDPSAQLNLVGIGFDSGDANFFVMTNDGTATATRTDTGIAIAATKLYEVRVFCVPNDSVVSVSLETLDDATLYEQDISSDLPGATTAIGPVCRANTGSSATTGAQIDLVTFYIETDY